MGLYTRVEIFCSVTEIGIEVNAEKTKYMITNPDQNAVRSHYMKVDSRSMLIIVQRNATKYSFIIFLQSALHVSDDNLIHHQEHPQTLITTSGTSRTLFATVRRRGGVSDDTLIHHQEHSQTLITTSGTSRTVFATVR